MARDRKVLLDAGGKALPRPVVYLDHSTLVDAFDGKRGAHGPNAAANADLAEIVEDVARRGTLCLSVIHVFELAPGDHAVEMAKWLGGLDPLWFQMDESANEELANEVRRRLGSKCAPAGRLPIYHAMSGAYRSSLFKDAALATAAQRLIDCPDIASMIRRIHGDQGLMKVLNERRAWSIRFFAGIHVDRSLIPKNTAMRAAADRLVEERVRKQVEDDACRLIFTTAIDRDESYPTEDEIRGAVRQALDDQRALPLTKIGQRVAGYVSDAITEQEARSGGFDERFRGFGWDSRHATAAAVVDVFTCDAFADGAIGDFRTSRGMERQISMRGRPRSDRVSLVEELRRQCAEPPADA